MSAPAKSDAPKPANFLRTLIERELHEGQYTQRLWGGAPGDGAHHTAGGPDPARVRYKDRPR